jgi:RNA polymerase sigma-70 factor (ECF subfamily)
MIDSKSDRDLLAAIGKGDHAALAELYDRHAPQMLAVALRILQDRRDAEDLLHDVFLEAWQKTDSYDAERGTVRTWLLMRVRSRAIDRMRTLAVAREHGMVLSHVELPAAPEDPSVAPDRARARQASQVFRTPNA